MQSPTSVAQSETAAVTGEPAGFIIATSDNRVSVGEGDVILIDQGQAHGVEVGDRFLVFQEAQRIVSRRTGQTLPVPRQVIGELEIFEVAEHISKAIIIDSQIEMSVGAPVAFAVKGGALGNDTELYAQANARLARLAPCIDMAHQAIRAAEAAGAPAAELAAAREALASAEIGLEQAPALLAERQVAQALERIDIALSDCLTAQDLANQSLIAAGGRAPGFPDNYTVARGDTLWGISAREAIYNNAFMWPIIYKANGAQIHDPDLIFPQQILAIPRGYSQDEAAAAIGRARRRGRWRLGDGADRYMLEGTR